jgi:hypothetical protein
MSSAMTRRGFLAGLGGAGLLAVAPWARGDEGAARPNFILCMTDDQGWGDVSYNGLDKIKTTNLDAMAAAGLFTPRRSVRRAGGLC